jgi:hypothetical protein
MLDPLKVTCLILYIIIGIDVASHVDACAGSSIISIASTNPILIAGGSTTAIPAEPIPTMYVVKRDGLKQPVSFDKITKRIAKLCDGLNEQYVDPVVVAQVSARVRVRGLNHIEYSNSSLES